MEVVQTVPILRIFDVAKLSEHCGDATPGASVFLRVTGLIPSATACASTRT